MFYSDEIQKEALQRLKLLQAQGLDETVVEHYKNGRIFFSRRVSDDMVLHDEVCRDEVVSKAVQIIESEYHVHVYYAVCNEMPWGMLVTMLFVDMDCPQEWEDEKAQMESRWVTGYAYDVTHDFSEAGSMPYRILSHAVVRNG